MSRREPSPGFHAGVYEVVHKTEKALLVRAPGGRETWIPLSVVHDDSELYDDSAPGGSGELVVFKWFAEKEGLDAH